MSSRLSSYSNQSATWYMLTRLLFFFCLFATGLAAQEGTLKGQITVSLTNEPIAFANVLVLDTDLGAQTDEQGNYLISGLAPGTYTVRASYLGYREQVRSEIEVTANRPTVVDFNLEEQATNLAEVVVQAEAFNKPAESPLSLRTIGVAEIRRNPGANRDISKVVQSLPGVTTTAGFRNDLIIRGGAPNENRFYLDGVEVPNINHFATQGAGGGPVGLINVNFIREVDFYSGAFPANRGNALSSIFDFKQRDGRDDRLGGSFTVSATDIGVTLEGPIGDQTTFLLSARRSYLQFLFEAIGLPFLPTYNDFQFKVRHRFDQRNELIVLGLGAIDQFTLNLDADDTEEKQFLLQQLPEAPQWNYTNGLVYRHYRDKGYFNIVLSRNMLNNEARKYVDNDNSRPENLLLDYRSQEIENKLRVEDIRTLGAFQFTSGAGYELVVYKNQTFNRIFTGAGAQTVEYSTDLRLQKYSAFGQLSRNFLRDRLSLSVGLRLDGNDYAATMSNPLDQFSPRFSAAYQLAERWSINFNTGIYYQLPPYTTLGYREGDRLVNRDNGLRYIRNTHWVAGVEWQANRNARFTLEGYYKQYADYPFLLRDSLTLANLGGDFGVLGNEPVVSRSAGRTYGVELLLQQRLLKGFYGIAAYTLGWSEFADKRNELVASSWDARHILSITAGKQFGKNWEIGINWRYQSALPYTPFAEESALVSAWDVNGVGIRDYDQLNTLRNTASNSVDLRVDKKWFFRKWNLNVYLDIENLTGNAVGNPQLILDRPLDEEGRPIGGGVVENPAAPAAMQRYRLKGIDDAAGTVIPSVGIVVEW